MRLHPNHGRAESATPYSIPVRFELPDPEAASVDIAGTFHHGPPDAQAMPPVENGRQVRNTVLPVGTYECCLVVDGEFCPARSPEKPCPTRAAGETRFSR